VGGACGFYSAGPANPAVQGVVEASRSISEAILGSLRSLGTPSAPDAVFVGAAGVVSREISEELRASVARRLGLDVSRVYVFEDLVAAHASVFLTGDGIVGIMGTGSSVYGTHRGARVRAGGWGHLLGDEGSAYRIGVVALREVLACLDGLESCSELATRLIERLNLRSVTEVLRYVYSSPNPKTSVASLSVLVLEEARRGCGRALEVVRDEVLSFSRYVAAVARRLGTERIRVGFVGSLYCYNSDLLRPILKEALRGSLGREVEVVEQVIRPCCGALVAGLVALRSTLLEVVVDQLLGCCRYRCAP
jgi:N-acetylglucosamine kinase-like BadF-type ATPase